MDIIEQLVNHWLNRKESFQNELDSVIASIQDHSDKIDKYNAEREALRDQYDHDCEDYANIRAFCNMIGIDCDEIDFFEEEECIDAQYDIEDMDLEEAIQDLQNENVKYNKSVEMLRDYIGILDRVSSGYVPERSDADVFRSDFELFMDIFVMQQLALQKYNENNSLYFDCDTFAEILDIFNTDTMKAIGHYAKDPCFDDERAENVCRICRISWEYDFFDKLDAELRYSRRMSRWKLKRNPGYKRIANAWLSDLYELNNSGPFTESVFFMIYNNSLPQEEIDNINYFIKGL